MFKFLVISDTHFGFGKGTEREDDCWVTVDEAIRRAPELGADFIVLPGDIFDVKIPRPEDWSRALELFAKSKVPIYATHGNHERRGQNLTNPVEGLHNGGVLTYIHGRSHTFELNGEKVSIYGLGWVPEAYSKEMFKEYGPKPVDDSYNIFIFHQSISPYIFNPMEPPSIGLDDLPEGFDLYINGHIHSFEKSKSHGKPFFIPGSTVTTQVNEKESRSEKGFVMVTVAEEAEMEFIPFESARKVFYREIDATGRKPSDVRDEITSFLNSINEERRPLVRVKVRGTIPKGISVRDFGLREVKGNYPNMILSLGANVTEEELEESRRLFDDIRDQRVSVDEIGMKILEDNMREMGSDFRFHDVFDHLADGDVDGAIKVLGGKE